MIGPSREQLGPDPALRKQFSAMTKQLEEELEHPSERFDATSRPIPETPLVDGLPPGHIALRGDFDTPRGDA